MGLPILVSARSTDPFTDTEDRKDGDSSDMFNIIILPMNWIEMLRSAATTDMVPDVTETVETLVDELWSIWEWEGMEEVFRAKFGVVHSLCWFMMVQFLSHLDIGIEDVYHLMPPQVYKVFKDEAIALQILSFQMRQTKNFDESGDRKMVSFDDACEGTIKWIKQCTHAQSSPGLLCMENNGLYV